MGVWILVLVAVALPVGHLVAQVLAARVLDRDLVWLAGGPVSAAEGDVLARYLHRHRIHRLVGGVYGVVLALVVGARWDGSVGAGSGQRGPLADVLFAGIAGVVVGALSAESYRLTRPRHGPVVASLAPRPALPLREHVVAAWLLVGAGLGVAVLGALTSGGTDGLPGVVFGIVVLTLATATRAAIVHRPRPVLSERAQHLDGRIRGFAAASIARLEVSAGCLALLWSFKGAPTVSHPALSVLYLVVVVGALVASIVFLRRAAPRPPAGWGGATLPRTTPAAPTQPA